ncbi:MULTISPECIES: hypothetical protein [Pseudomonas]|uniref:hypothetical protein n=1 Tax=Pseudomonas TaxID=286 RepID=UPI002361660D|nr:MULTISPECIES: hypothetical protein [Pseudomonas]WJV25858.1 hypothetical protein PSR66_07475 [Pseudomonas chlororaphis]
MIDRSELKRVAEAAESTFAQLCGSGGDDLAEDWHKAETEFADAANPAAVLELIAEIDRLESEAVYSAAGFQAAKERIDQVVTAYSDLDRQHSNIHTNLTKAKTLNAIQHGVMARLRAENEARRKDSILLDILSAAMAEVKATVDGLSEQPIPDIVAGCLAEISVISISKEKSIEISGRMRGEVVTATSKEVER